MMDAPPPAYVAFEPEARTFTLRTQTAAYFLYIAPDDALVHAGFAPVPPATPAAPAPAHLDAYPDSNANWDYQTRAFEYPTFGNVTYHDTALKVAFPSPPPGPADGDPSLVPVRDLRLRYRSHVVRLDAAPHGAPTHGREPRVATPRETLCIELRDADYDFRATLFYRVTPEHDLIERWVELANHTSEPVEIAALDFGVLHVPNGRYELTRVAGAWAREFTPVRQVLEPGTLTLDQRGLNTGHASNPFFLLNPAGAATEEAGTVFFGAIAWSGNWRLRFEALPTGPVRVFAGYEGTDFALRLAPGETHTTPAFVFGCTDEGRGGASRRLHRFTRERVLPGYDPAELRPVLYNSWEAAYFNLSHEHQRTLARIAASIGVELFVVDDGWFGARRHDRAGLGDWIVSRAVFPEGLEPLVADVHRLGMKFGLWFEPEMVNPDSELYRAHPDWVLHFPGRPRTESRHQLVLDFGRPEVVEHVFRAIDIVVRENGVDFIKWDMNRYATEPGSVAGASLWRRHVDGVYAVMDRLRRAHPRLEIQTCSGGGGRIDLGVLARADQAWTSDNTDAHDRVTIQDGFSLAYPPRVMEAWVTHESNHQTGRSSSLDLRFDVAMRGALGIGSALDRLSADELEAYRRKIAFYKKIRPVVQEGELHRLATRRDSAGVSTWLFVAPDTNQAVLSFVALDQPQGLHLAPPRLRGLRADAVYAVFDEHGHELGHYAGWQLMTLGLPVDPHPGSAGQANRSRTLWLEAVRGNPVASE